MHGYWAYDWWDTYVSMNSIQSMKDKSEYVISSDLLNGVDFGSFEKSNLCFFF